jgi:hypothetical protein
MTAPHDEFDDFLKRRKPLFDRLPDDNFEPPAELDRLVLRQAREAIDAEKPMRMFRAPRWSAPLALAATVLLTFSFFFHNSAPVKAPVPEVTVQTVAQQVEVPSSAAPPEMARDSLHEEKSAAGASADAVAQSASTEGHVVVDLGASSVARNDVPASDRRARQEQVADKALVSDAEANRSAVPPPAAAAPAPLESRALARNGASTASPDSVAGASRSAPAAKAEANAPAFRRDQKTWLAEIDRLRASGDVARAEEEMAEFKRQHRAYAGSPDR